MRLLTILLLALLSIAAAWVLAADGPKSEKSTDMPQGKEAFVSQLVTFKEPSDFTIVVDQPSAETYVRKAVPKGETADRWTQMITVTGSKASATHPDLSAQYFAAHNAAELQKACPTTFSVKPLGPTKISGQDAFVAVASCGKIDASGGMDSETALIVAIKSATGIHTVQWAERTAANAENLTIDESKWKGRLAELAPIRLCTIKPGEKPPYPSCANK